MVGKTDQVPPEFWFEVAKARIGDPLTEAQRKILNDLRKQGLIFSAEDYRKYRIAQKFNSYLFDIICKEGQI